MFRFHLSTLLVALTVACIVLALNCVPSAWEPSRWNKLPSRQRCWGWPLEHYYEYDRGFISPIPLEWRDAPSDSRIIPIAALANCVVGVTLVLVSAVLAEWFARRRSRRRNARRLRLQRLAPRETPAQNASRDLS
jgi:hypothetical protein